MGFINFQGSNDRHLLPSHNEMLHKMHLVDEILVLKEKDLNSGNLIPPAPLKNDNPFSITAKGLNTFLRQIFLPAGYPYSVPSEYTKFQIWNLIQDLCSYLRNIMSTRSILEGMGVGRSDITTVQATVQWILRDGASMLGGLLFTSLSSTNFGCNVKSWRFFADLINNVGITLEMIAPIFRKQFLPLICIGSVCKSLCGISAGAAGAAISEHWGIKNGNIADILAKNGAQHTVISLFGLLCSVPFVTFASITPQRVWAFYSFLTTIHILANYQAMRSLRLRSLNYERLSILVHNFITQSPLAQVLVLKAWDGNEKDLQATEYASLERNIYDWAKTSNALSLATIAATEDILVPIYPKVIKRLIIQFSHFRSRTLKLIRRGSINYRRNQVEKTDSESGKNPDIITSLVRQHTTQHIHLWTPPSQLLSIFSPVEVSKSLKTYDDCNYVILMNRESMQVYVTFKETFTAIDQIKAILEANFLFILISSQTRHATIDIDIITKTYLMTRKLSDRYISLFYNLLVESDWDMGRIQLMPSEPKVLSNL